MKVTKTDQNHGHSTSRQWRCLRSWSTLGPQYTNTHHDSNTCKNIKHIQVFILLMNIYKYNITGITTPSPKPTLLAAKNDQMISSPWRLAQVCPKHWSSIAQSSCKCWVALHQFSKDFIEKKHAGTQDQFMGLPCFFVFFCLLEVIMWVLTSLPLLVGGWQQDQAQLSRSPTPQPDFPSGFGVVLPGGFMRTCWKPSVLRIFLRLFVEMRWLTKDGETDATIL